MTEIDLFLLSAFAVLFFCIIVVHLKVRDVQSSQESLSLRISSNGTQIENLRRRVVFLERQDREMVENGYEEDIPGGIDDGDMEELGFGGEISGTTIEELIQRDRLS